LTSSLHLPASHPGRVGWICGDSGMAEEREALEQAIRAIGSEPEKLILLFNTDRGAVLSFSVEAKHALGAWAALREKVEETGYWPVIVDSEFCEERTEVEEDMQLGEDFADLEVFEVSAWFDKIGAELRAEALEYVSEERLDAETGCPIGEWPENPQPGNSLLIIEMAPILSNLALVLVPTMQSWEVPIYLSFGGWNECPLPGELAGLLRYWYEAWGAEPVAMSFDSLELRVARPPKEREAAFSLAQEQYLACQDIVGQGTYSLNALAAGLLDGGTWFLWWD
jgi:hypothetical protein